MVAADRSEAKRLVVWKWLRIRGRRSGLWCGRRCRSELQTNSIIGKLPLYDARSTTPVCFEVAAQGSGPSARRSTRRDQMAINRRRRRPLAERAQPKSKEASATPKNSTAPSQPSPPSRGAAPRPSKSRPSPPSRGAAPRPSKPSPPTTPRVDRLVGECVLKTFDDADYVGRVVALLPPDPDDRDTRPWYRVVYEDGDAEDLDLPSPLASSRESEGSILETQGLWRPAPSGGFAYWGASKPPSEYSRAP